MEINQKENNVLVSVNPKIYPLEVIYSAAYVLIDKAYIVIDGDPEEEVIVELKPKEKSTDLEILGRDFNNELLNYAVYKTQSEKNAGLRQALLQRALLTNDSSLVESTQTESEEVDYIDDPEGIAVPWEEKYGKAKKDSS
jgi:His-Xaa-Ser system protein HxsD